MDPWTLQTSGEVPRIINEYCITNCDYIANQETLFLQDICLVEMSQLQNAVLQLQRSW
jgi:hypothetical protein